jgi:RNA polymerase sigma-70 factor (ECF subfamily)
LRIREKEFIELIKTHEGLIHKIAYAYCDNSVERDDLKQEIIGQAWASYARYRGDAKFSTWLYRLALNTALTNLQKAKKKPDHPQEKLIHKTTIPAGNNAQELLDFILTKLNPIEKSIVLQLVEGFDHTEIAESLGISEGNARVKIHRVRKKLIEYGIE